MGERIFALERSCHPAMVARKSKTGVRLGIWRRRRSPLDFSIRARHPLFGCLQPKLQRPAGGYVKTTEPVGFMSQRLWEAAPKPYSRALALGRALFKPGGDCLNSDSLSYDSPIRNSVPAFAARGLYHHAAPARSCFSTWHRSAVGAAEPGFSGVPIQGLTAPRQHARQQ